MTSAPKTCPYCDKSSTDCTNRKVYCMDISTLRMILFGPRQVSNNHTCPKWTLADKYNMKHEFKPMCGLFNSNVVVSPYNDNGACQCINCGGAHCRDCSTYRAKVDAAPLNIFEPSACQLCLRYPSKTR